MKRGSKVAHIIIIIVTIVGLLMFVNSKKTTAYDSEQIVLGAKITKYVNYNNNYGKGTLVEYNLKISAEEARVLKESNLELSLGTMGGEYPQKVIVLPVSTQLTNGIEVNSLGEYVNYNYNQETGKVEIFAVNYDDDKNIIYTNGEGYDEYEIILIYGEKAYEENVSLKEEQQEGIELSLVAKVEHVLESGEENIQIEKLLKGTVTEQIGDLVQLKTEVESIYNGNIKSNIINNTNYTTEYTEQDTIVISDVNLYESIEYQNSVTMVQTYTTQEGQEQELNLGNDYITTKQTTLNKKQIQKVLGEQWQIIIYNLNGEELGTINQDTQAEEDGTITINFGEEKGYVLKTSAIQQEGIIDIKNTKQISDLMKNTEANIKEISALIGVNNVEQNNENGEVIVEEVKEEVNTNNIVQQIQNAETKIDVSFDAEELTNKETNKVNFTVKLDSSSNKYNMFINPEVYIYLPDGVKNVTISDTNLLHANGLTLQNVYVESLENETKVIKASLSGTQTQYNSNELGLTTTLNFTALIEMEKNIQSTTDKIQVVYTNNYTIDGNVEETTKEYNVQLVNYKESSAMLSAVGAQQSLNVSNQSVTQQIDGLEVNVTVTRGNEDITNQENTTVYSGEFLKYTIEVTNTTENDMSNVDVIADIPEGFTYVELEADYSLYEYNEDYETDGTNEPYSGYYRYDTEKYKDQKNINILEQTTIKAGETVEDFFEVYVEDKEESSDNGEQNSNETKLSIKTKVNEQEGEEISFEYTIQNSDVKAFLWTQIYSETINRNIGINIQNEERKDLKITVDLPKGFIPLEFRDNFEEDVYPGDSVRYFDKEYELNNIIDSSLIEDNDTDTEEIEESVEDEENYICYDFKEENGEYTSVIIYTNISGGLIVDGVIDGEDVLEYISENNLSSIAMFFVYATIEILNESDNNFHDNCSYIDTDGSLIIEDCYKFEEDYNETEIVESTIITNEVRIKYNVYEVEVDMTVADGKSTFYHGDTIEYNVTVTLVNKENGVKEDDAYISVNIEDFLPEEVEPVKVTYDYYESYYYYYEYIGTEQTEEEFLEEWYEKFEDVSDVNIEDLEKEYEEAINSNYEEILINEDQILNGEYEGIDLTFGGLSDKKVVTEEISDRSIDFTDEEGNIEELPGVNLTTYIKYGETLNITIEVTAGVVYTKEAVDNEVTISGEGINTVSDTVTINILPYDYEEGDDTTDPDNPEDPDNPNTPVDPDAKFNISGVVWEDANGDGRRQETEKLLDGVEVLLIDLSDSGNIKQSTTTSSGVYSFTNLDQSSYVVVFRYDTSKYVLSPYKATGVSDTENSDALQETITLNGQNVEVGITDQINLTQDYEYVDIGLINVDGYDLKLDKYISSISVTTTSGTKTYSYDNEKLAKVEIKAKELSGAEVTITYKIVITNEGTQTATVKEIYDYVPDGLTFSSSLNSSWTQESGYIVNKGLSSQSIEAGESKEATLVLTKTMTEDSTGTFTNGAEIGSAESVASALQDIDSTPGNKNTQEDDYSEAEVIISVSTGIILYISIALIIGLIIAIIVLGVFIYKGKIKLNKLGSLSKVGMVLFAIAIMQTVNITNYVNAADYNTDYKDTSFYYNGNDFSGGPGNQGGTCNNSGDAAIGNGHVASYGTCTCTNRNYYYVSMVKNGNYSVTGPTVVSSKDDTKITGTNTSTQLDIKVVGNYAVVGPFGLKDVNSNTPTLKVYTSSGSEYGSSYVGFSDANGNSKSLSKDTTSIYIRINLSTFGNHGISKITISQKYTVEKIVQTTTKAQYLYRGYAGTGTSGRECSTNPDGKYSSWYYHQDVFSKKVISNTSTTTDGSGTSTAQITWSNFKGVGKLIKVDNDDSSVKLDISYELLNSSGSVVKSGKTSGGEVIADNLTPGNYTFKETANDNYGYADNVGKTVSITIKSGKLTTVTMKNVKNTGTLQILKKDTDSERPLANVSFYIKDVEKDQYIIGVDSSGKDMSTASGVIDFYNMKYTNNINEATEFITDSEGKIFIRSMLIGEYEITEAAINTEEYGYELDNAYITIEATMTTGVVDGNRSAQTSFIAKGTNTAKVWVYRVPTTDKESASTTVNVYNQKKYVKISGYVWEDMPSGKNSSYNHLYNEGDYIEDGVTYESTDLKVEGITVRLKSSVLKDNNGNDQVIKETTTDENGNYMFEDVLIGGIDLGEGTNWGVATYYIEFEYDGVVYTTVQDYSELGYSSTEAPANTSKAQETEQERQELDNLYEEVTGTVDVEDATNNNATEAYGFVRDSMQSVTYDLTQGDDSTEAIATFSKEKSNVQSQHIITTDTQETGYNVLGGSDSVSTSLRVGFVANGVETVSSIREAGIEELASRNLGLREREVLDLSVATDLDNIKVLVDEYINTYRYGTIDYYDDQDAYRLDVKAKTVAGYTRSLYRSDIVKGADQAIDTTQIYMTYKININNKSSTLAVDVTELALYYDSRYEVVALGTSNDLENGTFEFGWEDTSKYGGSYTSSDGSYVAGYITGISDTLGGTLGAGGRSTIYIKYKLSNEAVLSVLRGDIQLNSVVEINSFTTYYGENTYYHDNSKAGTLYAGVDVDSAPGDIILLTQDGELNVNTYEDDTAVAPTVTMTLTQTEREISGTVFEDYSGDNEVQTGSTRLGDGVYNTAEDGTVQGVQVDLLVYNNESSPYDFDSGSLDSATLYKYAQNEEGEYVAYTEVASVVTGESGYYSFSGIVPDEYILRYTYADGNVVYRAGEEFETIDVDHYKSTIIGSEVIDAALKNNTISGDGSMASDDSTITYNGTAYQSKKWYYIEEQEDGQVVRYSDAIDNVEIVKSAIEEEKTINNSNYNIGTVDKVNLGTENNVKGAFSGVLNVQIEWSDENASEAGTTTTTQMVIQNSDGTYRYITDINSQYLTVDFGIVKQAQQKYEVVKEIANVKITLSSGQIIVDGAPSDIRQYVQYLPSQQRRSTITRIEMDDEILYGSTLEVTYKMTVINQSEVNYATEDYYKYGIIGSDSEIETIVISKVIDYLDNDLVYLENDYRIGEQSLLSAMTTEEQLEFIQTYIDESIRDEKDITKLWRTIIILESDKGLVPTTSEVMENLIDSEGYYHTDIVNDESKEEWQYQVSKVLATSDDLEFTNDVEEIEIVTINPTPDDSHTPGNYDPSEEITTEINDEPDNFNSTLIITEPTGEDRSATVYVVAAISLTILGAGVFIIKRKLF